MNGFRMQPATASRERSAANRLRILNIDTISIDWGASTELIRWHDVVSARSVRNCTEIATRTHVVKVHCSLTDVVRTLSGLGLVQVRRDRAVNASFVRRLIGGGRHRLDIVLENDTCLRVGRQFQRDIRARFGPRPAGEELLDVADA